MNKGHIVGISVLLRTIVVCAALLAVPQVFGSGVNPTATPCATTTLDVLTLDGSIGCNLGGVFNANDFVFTASAGAPLTASQINVTPTVTSVGGVVVLIDFSFSGNFTNTTSIPMEYTFDYILDPLSPVILGATLGLEPGGVLTENICAGGVFSGSTCTPGTAFSTTLVTTTLFPNASTAFPASVNVVDYHLALSLPAGASASGFDSGSLTGLGTSTAPVPEPSSILLTASGLLCLLSFRKLAMGR